MKTASNIRNRIIAGLLAVIVTISTFTIAASADNTNENLIPDNTVTDSMTDEHG